MAKIKSGINNLSSNTLTIGDNKSTTDKAIAIQKGDGYYPSLIYNKTTQLWQFANDGYTPYNIFRTNLTSYSSGDLLYAIDPTVIGNIPIGGDGYVMRVSGGIPTWLEGNVGPTLFQSPFASTPLPPLQNGFVLVKSVKSQPEGFSDT